MRTYEKIKTIFSRDTDGTKRLIPGKWITPTIEYTKDLEWEWTEKIDGTNIRIMWDGFAVSFGGRTNNARIPEHLLDRLQELFGTEEAAQMFEQTFGTREVIFFGEGYGVKIQADGRKYIPDGVDFIMFDVLIGDNYQSRETVEDIADMFGVECVPVVGHGTLMDAVAFVLQNPHSTIGDLPMEGLVCRPSVELQDRCGERLIVKIKYKDFKHLSEYKEA